MFLQVDIKRTMLPVAGFAACGAATNRTGMFFYHKNCTCTFLWEARIKPPLLKARALHGYPKPPDGIFCIVDGSS
jgi:hypothetical protein